MNDEDVSHPRDHVLIVAFVLILLVPCHGFLHPDTSSTHHVENRRLAEVPDLAREPVVVWPLFLDRYLKDHVGFRTLLIGLHNRAKLAIGVSPVRGVVLGRHGWLFADLNHSVEDLCGTTAIDDDKSQEWPAFLEKRQKRLAAQGIHYLFVIPPNKETIYPEYLPPGIPRGRTTRLDRLLPALLARGIPVLDLRPNQLAARKREQVYSRQDTHWNDFGIHAAHSELITRLSEWFPALAPIRRDDFSFEITSHLGDLAQMCLIRDPETGVPFITPVGGYQARRRPLALDPSYAWPTWPEQSKAPCVFERPGRSLKVLVFHDSFFGESMMPLLAEGFARTAFVGNVGPDDRALEVLVRSEKPDLVIEEHVERILVHGPPRPQK